MNWDRLKISGEYETLVFYSYNLDDNIFLVIFKDFVNSVTAERQRLHLRTLLS